MVQKNFFYGTFTAIVTPFNDDYSVDYGSLNILINRQIEAGVEGIVFLGTTGESPTIDSKEHIKIFEFAVEKVQGKSKVIASTGCNCTSNTIKKSIEARSIGVDGLMLITPYYNKPSQSGLLKHFSQISEAVHDIPIILYSVQSRTGVNISKKICNTLMNNFDNILSIKEASGNISQIQELCYSCKGSVMSGDDSLAFLTMACGGKGVISVVSNLFPKEMKQIIDLCLANKFDEARILNGQLLPLINCIMSVDSNPIGIKEIMSIADIIKLKLKPPLYDLAYMNKMVERQELSNVYHKYLKDKILN